MNYKKFLLFLFVLTISLNGLTQANKERKPGDADTASVNKLVQQSKDYLKDDPVKSISFAIQAKDLAEKINFPKGKASAFKFIGLGYYYQGKYLETLANWNESLKIFEELKDDLGVANLLNNIAAVYGDQGDDANALAYSLRSLKLSEQVRDTLRILSALNTIGNIYNNKKATKDKALDYLLKALPLTKQIDNQESYGIISENIGQIYFEKEDDKNALKYFEISLKVLDNSAYSPFAYSGIGKVYLRAGDFDKALKYHEKAYTIAQKLDGKLYMVGALQGIANVYLKQKNYPAALNNYTKATVIAEELKATTNLKDLYQEMALAYAEINDYRQAFKYRSLYANIKDTLYNIETDKKLGSLQFDFDLQKKQGEINLLTKDKDLQELQIKRQKLARNALAGGLAFVVLIALLIFKNYWQKVKTNKILDAQKDQIEHLLLNILPSEVAKELQVNGQATPRNYDTVSVMFTDFKNFTTHADKLSPQELVKELNACFIAFDNIIGQYNLEKIKTIGDSYMCAGGIPTPDLRQAYNIVNASLDIQDYIILNNKRRIEEGLEPWYLRIGIHVGPVVAGVVGKKKYAYDIWGSTVNIASRMESNGAPGQVNISASTYELIKDEFTCSYRGKINAKNVGEIDMYFVQRNERFSLNDIAEKSVINQNDKPSLLNG
ncbi:MAG: adenylate/guanylate cyclase domain-containing protein [Ferruginibacter sp.]